MAQRKRKQWTSRIRKAEKCARPFRQLITAMYFDHSGIQVRAAAFVRAEVQLILRLDREPMDYQFHTFNSLAAAMGAAPTLLPGAKPRIGELEIYRDGKQLRDQSHQLLFDMFAAAWLEAFGMPKVDLDMIRRDRRSQQKTLREMIATNIRAGASGLKKLARMPNYERRRMPSVRGRRFEDLQLSDAFLNELDFVRCSFAQCSLAGASFASCNLASADFRDTNLATSNFSNASLRSADFRGADLTEATFSGATLYRAQFYGADLTGSYFCHADLRDADFRGAIHVDADFEGARYNTATRWPRSFKKPETMRLTR